MGLNRKPGQWIDVAKGRASRNPGGGNPHAGPVLSNLITGRGTRSGGHTDSRGNHYGHVPSGNERHS